jgi:hypothetical protein
VPESYSIFELKLVPLEGRASLTVTTVTRRRRALRGLEVLNRGRAAELEVVVSGAAVASAAALTLADVSESVLDIDAPA